MGSRTDGTAHRTSPGRRLQLLMEHGEYVPLELLLATNRLGYEDYRAWREGRLETLDAVLADGKRESCAWLEAAQSWACALGLAAEPTVHHGWEENAGTVLVASSDLRLNALLSTRCRHIRQHDQLDLFIDSAQTAAVNALVDALAVRNVGVFVAPSTDSSESTATTDSGSTRRS